jgi:hypothetical protein
MPETSIMRAVPATDKDCTVCNAQRASRAFDLELNGRVCDDCIPFLMHADYLLGALPMLFDRPEAGLDYRAGMGGWPID